MEKVESGKEKLHTGTLAPYELVRPFLNSWPLSGGSFMRGNASDAELHALNATWSVLPDFCGSGNSPAVIDTSGSMFCDAEPLPAAVALSLGLYFAQHNTGKFKDHFIMFSANPQLIETKGETFVDKLRYVCSFNEVPTQTLKPYSSLYWAPR